MSHFYADIIGQAGAATRCGSRNSGISGHIRGWKVGVIVRGRYTEEGDFFDVWATPGSGGDANSRYLGRVFKGPDGSLEFTRHTEGEV